MAMFGSVTFKQRPDFGFTSSGLLSPAPFLSACAVAVPDLKRRSAGSRAASDVQTLVERTECAVVAVPGPALRGGLVTGENLDHGSVVRARSGVVDALAGGAEDWTCAAILRLNNGRCVEVVTGGSGSNCVIACVVSWGFADRRGRCSDIG